ncbi:ABC transporter ATP-binding protein [Candidatus Dojkabacteria bacterium]|jgi:putative ABC transport system ATP-binding protein|nr:ABC transporter ATP-binding protein [Candidatus Dojkabacteria bacterium]
MIEVKDLKKTYKSGKNILVHAINDISFTIRDGQTVAIIGPSGSGKSTILNILGGLDSKYKGEVLIDGKDLKKHNSNYYRRKLLGTIFQQFYLIPTLNVAGNISLPITFGKQLRRKEQKERLNYLLKKVGLENRSKHMPNELSGGQAQRVAIARALMAKPKILLCDEPTGNLDSKTGKEIVELLFDLNKEEGTTLIIVTHDESLFDKVDRKIYLIDGRITKNV